MITLDSAATISNARMQTLQPEFAERVRAWYLACLNAGLKPYIYEGIRTSARQNELFKIGRTVQRQKAPVTYVRGGGSMHQYGVAIDFAPLVPAKKAAGLWEIDWSDKAYAPYHKMALKFELRRLNFETPHLEDARLKDVAAARARYGPPA